MGGGLYTLLGTSRDIYLEGGPITGEDVAVARQLVQLTCVLNKGHIAIAIA